MSHDGLKASTLHEDNMASVERFIEVFDEAKARPVGAERDHFLSEACQGDPELKEQVLSLLQAHESAGGFLQNSLVIPPVTSLTEKAGDKIGRYKLLQKIGEGGCGVVYMAEQQEPVRRRVAFKIIKLGMDTKQVIARFEAERQAIALMDHPNIAKVFDAGATNTGRPYFVMELVRGLQITEFCDQSHLPTEERVKLFTQVCHAIQHAHQKGIIHRDIKPSNVIVTVNDGMPVPKVIDFGIAKAIDQRLTDKTLFTAFEQFIGTPAYMSPEQAGMTSLDIDTRGDIYSLGVLLYELLTGNTPLDTKELLAFGLAETRRIIREQEPPKPSTRLNTLSDADLSTVALRRHTDATKLIHILRGDLDWIVMKCLEKDRARRYETANGLAMDLLRYLKSEPVVARPPTSLYRFQKLVRRNRASLAALSTVMLVLLACVCVSISFLIRENTAIKRALFAEQSAKEERSRNDQATVSMTKSGTALLKRGDLEAAEKWLLEALAMRRTPPDGADRQAAELLSALANLRHWQRDFGEAERLARESIEIRRRLQQDDPALARTLNFLADSRYELGDLSDAEQCFREGLAILRRNESSDPGTLQWSLYALAETLDRQNRFAEAEPLYRELLARPDASMSIDDSVLSPAVGSTRCLTELAWLEQQLGKNTHAVGYAREAEKILRAGLEMQPQPTGNRSWQLAEMKSRLGGCLVVEIVADVHPPAERLSAFATVEPLLLESGAQLQDDPVVHTNYKRDAISRLVRLYEVWNDAAPNTGKLERASEWRENLTSFDKAVAEKKAAAKKR